MNRFVKLVLSGLMAFALADAGNAVAQGSSVQARTQAIVASFNKFKHKVMEKRGVRREKYKDVRSTPAIKSDIRDTRARTRPMAWGCRSISRSMEAATLR